MTYRCNMLIFYPTIFAWNPLIWVAGLSYVFKRGHFKYDVFCKGGEMQINHCWPRKLMIYIAVLLSFANVPCHADLIGQWTFEGSNALQDQTGNWGDLNLNSGASIVNGQLDINRGQWAGTSGYFGPDIIDKTLVTWVTLDDLSVRAGSAISLDTITGDQFDGIVFSENTSAALWQSGSNNGLRNTISSGLQAPNQLAQIAISYRDLGSNNVEVLIYRDGNQIGGQVFTNQLASWSAGNAEILFGIRHTPNGGVFAPNSNAWIDGKIKEARIYNTALTGSELANLEINSVPEPSAVILLPLAACLIGQRRRRK